MSLALELPLAGTQLIEASAGTGKTWTIAGLYLRALIERRLELGEILVVTFTRAATDELKQRLRRRLLQAAALAEAALRAAPEAPGRYLHERHAQALENDDTEIAFATKVLERALDAEKIDDLVRRLRLAAAGMDEAAIHTIHGYCQRVLREQAFASGEALDAGELIGSDRDLIAEIAADFWRLNASEVERSGDFEILSERFGGASPLAEVLSRIVDAELEVHPKPDADAETTRAALAAAEQAHAVASEALALAWSAHGEADAAAVSAHVEHLNQTSHKLERIAHWYVECRERFGLGQRPSRSTLQNIGAAYLDTRVKKGRPSLPPLGFALEVDRWLAADDALAAARARRWPALLAEARVQAITQLEQRKQRAARQSYDDLIRRVYAALRDPQHGARLAAALHERHPLVLVDEFQDTDARQFDIFRRMHAARPGGALILVGDPKQAIYRFRGGDIEAYLRAAATTSAPPQALTRNFRSSPGLLRAVAAVFAQGGADAPAFVDSRIRWHEVEAGGRARDDDVRIDGAPIVPLTAWHLPAAAEGSNKDAARALLAAGCAEAIVDLLRQARAGRATILENGKAVPLAPRHLAVLVAQNQEAVLMQDALAARGVASATIRHDSVFASAEAHDSLLLLRGLESHDEAGLRAALATRLFGRDAAALAALADPAQPERWQRELQQLDALQRLWRERGVLALFERVLETRAAAILEGHGGERRLTNYLQLAELLQGAGRHRLGGADLTDWLQRRIAEADERNEEEQLRLEGDADRVQIATIHASKGLEYDLVFLPFTALAPSQPNHYPRLLEWHAGAVRALSVGTRGDADGDATAAAQAAREELAERVRVLYVALTRARYACWLSWDAIGRSSAPAALAQLWHGGAMPRNADEARAALQRLQASAADVVRVAALPAPTAERLDPVAPAALPPARRFHARLDSHWWIASFSQLRDGARVELADAAGGDDETAAIDLGHDDEIAPVAAAAIETGIADWPRGERFGTAMHEILERTDFAAWRGHADALAPPAEREAIRARLQRHALVPPERENELQRVVARMTAMTLNARLPAGAVLAALPPPARRAELPFHFAIGAVAPERLLALLREYGYQSHRAGFARAPERLVGLMTGVIDLVYRHDGRWWIVDYKTNWLGSRRSDYAGEALATAVREHDYDLQYLIYTVALHRWLRGQLGAAWDYERDFGGAIYLFLRGLERDGDGGIYVDRPPRALIEALDALFAPAPRRSGGGAGC